MFKFSAVIGIVAAGLLAPMAFSSSLQDWEFNVNGTDYYPAGGSTFASVPGLNVSGFNATTGQGTLTLTFNPGAAGTYYVGAFFYTPVGIPFYNEYGAVNGSAASGQSWQIDVPEYDVISGNHGAGTIVDNLASGSLNDTNSLPGSTSNYLNNCGANGGGSVTATCNDFVSLATGFKFTLTSKQEEIITFDVSPSNPGGFSIEDIHPVDGSNTNQAAVFLSGSAAVKTVGGGGGGGTSPEPASLGLVATAGVLALYFKRRNASRS